SSARPTLGCALEQAEFRNRCAMSHFSLYYVRQDRMRAFGTTTATAAAAARSTRVANGVPSLGRRGSAQLQLGVFASREGRNAVRLRSDGRSDRGSDCGASLRENQRG